MVSPPLVGQMTRLCFQSWPQMAPQVRYLVLNPHPTRCLSLGMTCREIQQVLWAKAEGIERQTHLDLLKRTGKSSIWCEGDDEEMTLSDFETPVVYSLHFVQQGCQDCEDELPPETMAHMEKAEKGKSNLHDEEHFAAKLESMNLDPHHGKLRQKYQEVLGASLPPLSCQELVQMDVKLKPEFECVVKRRTYPAPQDRIEEIERQIQECIDTGLVKEYMLGEYRCHCSACLLVAKPGSTAMHFVVDYGSVSKKTENHSGSIPNMENTLERMAKSPFMTKMDRRIRFWEVDLT